VVLAYAHHDVQPPMREALWKSPAFEPTIRDGRLFGRGSSDDKAGVILCAAIAKSFKEAGEKCPLQLKVLIDPEEEIGSPNFKTFLEKHHSQLKADVLVIADLTHFDTGFPTLTTALRGLAVVEVEVRVLEKPLHSGMWGGPIPDPVMGLSKILSGLTDEKGKILLPDIYDQVIAPRKDEVDALRELPSSDAEFRRQAGVVPSVKLFGANEEIFLKLWREPSLVVNAFEAGSRMGAGNVLMDMAWARVGIRTVPGMDAKKIQKHLSEALIKLCPWGLDVKVTPGSASDAWITDSSHPIFQAMKKSMKSAYGKNPVDVGCGGSIPFVGEMTKALGGIPALLIPLEDPYTNAHGENESQDLGDFNKIQESMIRFVYELAG
jgi:acetylornithine deacetylase/succinyl-diaminopimelate desuccinylase-like protein